MARLAFTAALLALSLVVEISAQVHTPRAYGTVQGRALDPNGKPVAAAQVYASPTDGNLIGKRKFALTDENGYFVLAGVPEGEQMILAEKPQDFFPAAGSAALSSQSANWPTVLVRAGETIKGVRLTLIRGAKLSLRIWDATNDEPVITARILLTRVDHPDFFYDVNPNTEGYLEQTIPPDAFYVEVYAPGYERWKYGDVRPGTEPKAVLLLAPGETRTIQVKLRPVRSKGTQAGRPQ